MPQVQISDELFKRAQRHAVPLIDTVEDVFNRALDALESGNGHTPSKSIAPLPPGPSAGSSDLVSYVGRVPHGTELRMNYKGTEYLAEVKDGKVIWNGRSYKSVSDAAVAVIRSTGSDRPTEDGWRVWQAKDSHGRWTPLVDLRERWRS
jgi:hypothetical protein